MVELTEVQRDKGLLLFTPRDEMIRRNSYLSKHFFDENVVVKIDVIHFTSILTFEIMCNVNGS